MTFTQKKKNQAIFLGVKKKNSSMERVQSIKINKGQRFKEITLKIKS